MCETILFSILGAAGSEKPITAESNQKCPRCGTVQIVSDKPSCCTNAFCNTKIVRKAYSGGVAGIASSCQPA